MAFKIGAYDQRIEFIKNVSIDDGAGGSYPSTETILSTYAVIEQLQQSRDLEQAQMTFPSTYRVKIMYRESFEPKVNNQVKWRGNVYNIISAPQIDDVRMSKEYVFNMIKSE